MVSGNQDYFDAMVRQALQWMWKDYKSRWVNGSQKLPGGQAGMTLLWGEGSHKKGMPESHDVQNGHHEQGIKK